MPKTERRLDQLRRELEREKADAVLVTGRANMRYLSGFGGGAGAVLVTTADAWLVTDGRFREEAEEEATGFRVICQAQGESPAKSLGKLVKSLSLKRILGEEDHLSVSAWNQYKASLEGMSFTPCRGMVEKLRLTKDEDEIAALRRAARAADSAFAQILPRVAPGSREADLSLDLERAIIHAGAEKKAFDFIVASGRRSSRPHGSGTLKELEKGDLVVFDFGAVWDGYHSDTTRTLTVGQPTARQAEIYELVRRAQEAALALLRPGIKACDVDRAAREIIVAAGLGEAFIHATGHGVGLEIHEGPRLGATSEAVLEEGMVITIEPGVYIPGWGGIRLEETAVVRSSGPEILTGSPKQLFLGGSQ